MWLGWLILLYNLSAMYNILEVFGRHIYNNSNQAFIGPKIHCNQE